jgi:hypothetical protein
MGLKGYRLWAMGQLDSTCRAPPPRDLLGYLGGPLRQVQLELALVLVLLRDPPQCSAAG